MESINIHEFLNGKDDSRIKNEQSLRRILYGISSIFENGYEEDKSFIYIEKGSRTLTVEFIAKELSTRSRDLIWQFVNSFETANSIHIAGSIDHIGFVEVAANFNGFLGGELLV